MDKLSGNLWISINEDVSTLSRNIMVINNVNTPWEDGQTQDTEPLVHIKDFHHRSFFAVSSYWTEPKLLVALTGG
jgi:hypothetical protein